MSSNYDLIRAAIEGKMQVTAEYNRYVREMCLHVLGRKNGSLQALFYQFGGDSSSDVIIADSLFFVLLIRAQQPDSTPSLNSVNKKACQRQGFFV